MKGNGTEKVIKVNWNFESEALDRLISVMEKLAKQDLEEKEKKIESIPFEVNFADKLDFLREEMDKVAEKMKKEDIGSDRYRSLLRSYNDLLSTARYF